jgi:hypothetical protein
MGLPLQCFVFAHHESNWTGRCVWSVNRSAALARNNRPVECTLIVRGNNHATRQWVSEAVDPDWSVVLLDDPDLAAARNHARDLAGPGLVAFVDASDLLTESWLSVASAEAEASQGVWRPEAIIHFGDDIFSPSGHDFVLQVESTEVRPTGTNPFSSGFVTTAETVRAVEWPSVDEARGWLDVDWWWCCLVSERGIPHRIVSETAHFRRSSVRLPPAGLRFGPVRTAAKGS